MLMNIVNQVKERVKHYIDVKINLLKLNLIGHVASLMSNFIFMLICLVIFFCILLFWGMGLAEVFTDWGLSKAASYFLTMGIYLVLLFLSLLFKNSITGFFANTFIKTMTSGDEQEK